MPAGGKPYKKPGMKPTSGRGPGGVGGGPKRTTTGISAKIRKARRNGASPGGVSGGPRNVRKGRA